MPRIRAEDDQQEFHCRSHLDQFLPKALFNEAVGAQSPTEETEYVQHKLNLIANLMARHRTSLIQMPFSARDSLATHTHEGLQLSPSHSTSKSHSSPHRLHSYLHPNLPSKARDLVLSHST